MALGDAPGIIGGAGLTAARIVPVNYSPVDGSYCFAVGSDVPGVFDTVAVGDTAGIEQIVDVSTLTLLSFAIGFRQTEGKSAAHVRGRDVTYPTGWSGPETLDVKVDGGGTQSIDFTATDQTLAQVVARVSAGLTTGTARADNGQLRIDSPTTGASSSVEVVGGTALPALGLTVGTETGEHLTFKVEVYLDTSLLYEEQLAAGQSLVWAKRTVNVKNFTGSHTLRFTAKAVAA